MSLFEAFILALVQGVTEFLPISSTAHLVLVPYLLGWGEHSLTYDVVTNAGTLLAAAIYLRRDLVETWQKARRSLSFSSSFSPEHPNLALLLAVGTIPVAICGFLFHDWFATTARAPVVIAVSSIGFGLVLWWADRTARLERDLDDLRWSDAVWVGLAQAVALIPGTSRSGITWTAALFRGFTREDAGRFSFLLAIPVGVLALGNDVLNLVREGIDIATLLPLAVGFVVAGISAYFTIGALLAWVRNRPLTVFVVYRIVLGIVILAVVQGR